MIAIDTSILLRYLLADDAKQFAIAKKLTTDNSPVLIADVALVETVWTLMGKRYELDKKTICEVLFSLRIIRLSGLHYETMRKRSLYAARN